jgi:hypothetical protein
VRGTLAERVAAGAGYARLWALHDAAEPVAA